MSPYTVIAGLAFALIALLAFTVRLLMEQGRVPAYRTHGRSTGDTASPGVPFKPARAPRVSRAGAVSASLANDGAVTDAGSPLAGLGGGFGLLSLMRPKYAGAQVAAGVMRASQDSLFGTLRSMAEESLGAKFGPAPTVTGSVDAGDAGAGKARETAAPAIEWGSVLDSGTGDHSLQWIMSLGADSWTAVTADKDRHAGMLRKFSASVRPGRDRIVLGNWLDPGFLVDPVTGRPEVFDVVLEDYLLGAVEGFSPYFQNDIFLRLRPHVGRALLLIGLEPYPKPAPGADPDGDEALLHDTVALRDASLLLAGRRPYREYPLEWITARMEEAGFRVASTKRVPLYYGKDWVKSQVNVATRFLSGHRSEKTAEAVRERAAELARRAEKMRGRCRFGDHHLIVAVPESSGGGEKNLVGVASAPVPTTLTRATMGTIKTATAGKKTQ